MVSSSAEATIRGRTSVSKTTSPLSLARKYKRLPKRSFRISHAFTPLFKLISTPIMLRSIPRTFAFAANKPSAFAGLRFKHTLPGKFMAPLLCELVRTGSMRPAGKLALRSEAFFFFPRSSLRLLTSPFRSFYFCLLGFASWETALPYAYNVRTRYTAQPASCSRSDVL